MNRHSALLDEATDHVLEHGLIGLTLRPLAAGIGTSDRMLIYHFGTRDTLVAAVVARVEERATATVAALPAAQSVQAGVESLWEAYRAEPLRGCLRVYLQAAATGLIGHEPHLGLARAANERWSASLATYLLRCGAPDDRVERVVHLIDSALYGFHLDLITDRPDELASGVSDLAAAAQALALGRRTTPGAGA